MKKIGNTYFSTVHGHTVRIVRQTGGVWYEVSRTDSPDPLPDEVHETQLTQPWKS